MTDIRFRLPFSNWYFQLCNPFNVVTLLLLLTFKKSAYLQAGKLNSHICTMSVSCTQILKIKWFSVISISLTIWTVSMLITIVRDVWLFKRKYNFKIKDLKSSTASRLRTEACLIPTFLYGTSCTSALRIPHDFWFVSVTMVMNLFPANCMTPLHYWFRLKIIMDKGSL